MNYRLFLLTPLDLEPELLELLPTDEDLLPEELLTLPEDLLDDDLCMLPEDLLDPDDRLMVLLLLVGEEDLVFGDLRGVEFTLGRVFVLGLTVLLFVLLGRLIVLPEVVVLLLLLSIVPSAFLKSVWGRLICPLELTLFLVLFLEIALLLLLLVKFLLFNVAADERLPVL